MKSSPPDRYPADTLGLDPQEMQRLGYLVVDLVIQHLTHKDSLPAIQTGTPRELWQRLGGPVPEEPEDIAAAIQLLVDTALRNQQHGDHPRYFARVPGPSSFAAVLGEWLGTGFNTMAASWVGGSGPSTVELVTIEWLRELLHLPAQTEGVLTSGGSIANLTALSAARSTLGPGVVYLSDQAHSCVARGFHQLGYESSAIRILPSDNHFRLPLDRLRSVVQTDLNAGLRPTIVVASAGTTNTGTVDPISEIADLCRQHDMWLHVDAAYGGPAALTARGSALLGSIGRADSVVLDPHKWLFQPYDIGCTLVTRAGALDQAFSMNPEYLKDVEAAPGSTEVDFRSRGFETSRRSRALKLWLTFKAYGVNRIRAAIDQSITLAEHAEAILRESGVWEIVSPAQLGIVVFAHHSGSASVHSYAAHALDASGFATLSTSVIKGRNVLRLCLINPLTTLEDIRETVQRLQDAAAEAASGV